MAKSLLTLAAVVVTFIPVWVFLAVRHVLHPAGFWQNLATGVAGVALLGGIQIFLIVLCVVFLHFLWTGR